MRNLWLLYFKIKKSGRFDAAYYLLNNPDVRAADVDPLFHFIKTGWKEGRDPSPEIKIKFLLNEHNGLEEDSYHKLVGIFENNHEKDTRTLSMDEDLINRPKLNFSLESIKRSVRFVKNFGIRQFFKKVRSKVVTLIPTKENKADNPSFPKNSDNPYMRQWLASFNTAKPDLAKEYIPYNPSPHLPNDPRVDLIAFYLPQFHPIPENDLWWGKGFTEWTNVSKAQAQFVGHYQPRLPGDLGFYDLRVPQVQEQQATLALHYGLSAFCFHYYWFSGKRLLENPLDLYISNPNITFPFCICWANEDWTRRWDGSSGQVLISQEHSFDNDKLLIHDLVELFNHPNYYRVGKRPLLIVYRADLLDEPAKTLAYWRSYSKTHGTGEPLILAALTFFFKDPIPGGFDGAVSFPPHHMPTLPDIADQLEMLNPDYRGDIFRYSDMARGFIEKLKNYPYKFYPTVVPSWDNEPRRPGTGMTIYGSTPDLYGEWLHKACQYQIANKPAAERLVFINAWNEWAESAYIEPDRRYGYAYLQKTADIMRCLSGLTVKSTVNKQLAVDEFVPKYVKSVSHQWPLYYQTSELSDKEITQISSALETLLKNVTASSQEKPKVSIIIPVYNHFEATLNCLKSIAAANDKAPVELILVDDGSSDVTQRVLELMSSILYIRNEQNLGFLLSCNKAADRASGDFICFLNNDTMVLPGWVDSIMESFVNNPQAGLIGSKLYYPDGTLQEAGGLIWNDGGGTNFGRDDDPKKPEYCFMRDVDYCSGAAIFLPRGIWEEMKGFDPIFTPAYYEDTDLAFRIRQAGYKVMMQPFSKVVHLEGVTSGTDLSQGIKHYQAINKDKFFQRWKDVLTSHNSPLVPSWTTNSHGKRKKALVLDVCTPKPDIDSGSIDTFNYLISLVKYGLDVTFISTDDSHVIDRYVFDLQSRGIHCLYPPYLSSIEQFIKDFGIHYDLVVLFRAPFGGRYMKAVKKNMPKAKVIFNTVDLHFLREKREQALQSSGDLKAGGDNTTEEYEVGLMKAADISILVSEYERILLAQLYPELKTVVMPIPREIPGRKQGFEARKDIAFVGGYLHKPNVDAVHYFVKEIWPMISEKLPGVKFKVVGSNMPEEFKIYASDNIELVGFVQDLGFVFDNVRLSVAPLRYGAGIKGKVVSSLSYGLPCVATSIAIEGMGLTEGQNVLTSDSPEVFAELVIKAYSDEALWESLSSNGLEFVKAKHSIENFDKNLDYLLSCLSRKTDQV